MRKFGLFVVMVGLLAAFVATSLTACDVLPQLQDSDTNQRIQQEKLLREGNAETGMPNIVNFRERKILKDILELRDQKGLNTYTYLYNEMSGKLVPFCASEGYGIPYSTQYTNPQKIADSFQSGSAILPQAEPNGLFSPSSAEGTWILCQNPHTQKGDVQPVYVEPRIVTSPFPLG